MRESEIPVLVDQTAQPATSCLISSSRPCWQLSWPPWKGAPQRAPARGHNCSTPTVRPVRVERMSAKAPEKRGADELPTRLGTTLTGD
jgi:hypothetical protein